ncbi:MAG: Crp/Fnr family transcriptional regulator [Gammaproteobacteria bacterium]|nr:Crp/Fnr family transcriptional regulator [Gammaproteobacteria bacterium]
MSPNLSQVALHQNQVLYAPGDVIEHVYFPNDAVSSLLFNVDEQRTVEVAMEGNEGVAGLAIFLGGANSRNQSIVRDAGTAMQLDVKTLQTFSDHCDNFKELLRRYIHALLTQVAQSGVCNRFHNIDARLARWLLMTHDRLDSKELHATQESIAQMLGVRRSSITAAASGFHKRHIIDYHRGRIRILDQARLRAASCACYEMMRHQYDSFLT